MNFHACQAQHTFLILEWNELHGVGRRSHQGGHQINRERVCEEPHHERAAAHIAEGKCVLKNGMKFIIKYRLFLNMHHHRSLLCRHGPCDLCVSAHTWDIIVSLHLILKNFTVKQIHFIQVRKSQTLLRLFSNFKLQKIGFLVLLVAEDDKAPNGIFTTSS